MACDTIQPYKRRKSCALQPHGWTGGHYGKWNKPGTERQTPHDTANMWNVEQSNSTEVGHRAVLPGAGEEGVVWEDNG
jgi:hypothetical protein